jgi:hypothetical protein
MYLRLNASANLSLPAGDRSAAPIHTADVTSRKGEAPLKRGAEARKRHAVLGMLAISLRPWGKCTAKNEMLVMRARNFT